MHYLDCREQIQHRTGDIPLAYYYVDEKTSPRYRMPMHWHRETEIIRIVRGSLRLYLDHAEFLAGPGDLVCIGSGVIHGGDPENCIYECIVYDPQAMAADLSPLKQSIRTVQRNNLLIPHDLVASDKNFAMACHQLFELGHNGFSGQEMALWAAVFSFISGQLRSMKGSQVQSVSEKTWEKAEQLKPALEYIEQHFNQPISLDTLAALSGFSPRYFCRYFRTIVHRTPIDYLNYYRAEYAARYLSGSEMNVAEVAALCGYADSSTFIKQFRHYKGVTPKQYKLQTLHDA